MNLLKLCVIFACFVYISAENEGKIVHYTAETFSTEISKNNHFVMFYAPWCGYCKKLFPIWEQLASMLNEDPKSDIIIAKVDCTVDKNLCSDNDVTGYPTLKFFKTGTSDAIKFRGTRDLPSLTSFINEQLGKSGEHVKVVPPTTVDGLTELTESSFHDHVKKGNFFIKFYAPWCGHCQKLAPVWEELAKHFEKEENVGIAKVDCTLHRSICNTFDVKGYPTLLWLKDGKAIEKYQGSRTEPELRSYVNRMLGTRGAPKEDGEGSRSEGSRGLITLNSENFSQGIAEGLSFVKFFAPWCGHCKRLAPIWSELNKKVEEGLSNTRLVKVDCTQENSKELCHEQEIEGFPTLNLYRNGKKITEYNGSRNLEDMYDFLTKHLAHDEL